MDKQRDYINKNITIFFREHDFMRIPLRKSAERAAYTTQPWEELIVSVTKPQRKWLGTKTITE